MTTNYHVRLFGELSIQHGEETITRFRTRKAAHLLGYLALNLSHVHTREALIDLFWGEMEMDAGRDNLSAALASLRRQMEPTGIPAGAFIQADRQSVRLNSDTVTTDVLQFERLLKSADMEGTADDAKIPLLAQAADLYRGDLLEGCYEEWAIREQFRLQERYLSALETLTTLYARADRWDEALAGADKVLRLSPYSETVRRAQMRAYAAQGKREQVKEVYRELEAKLQTDFQTRPEPATRRLFEQIQNEPEAFRRQQSAPTAVPSGAASSPPTPPAALPEVKPSSPMLPLQLTRFFGREKQIAEIQALFQNPEVRLVTLLGPGGVGKTRLSVELGKRLASDFGGRVFFAELASCLDAAQIPERIAQALRLPPAAGDPIERIVQALGQERTLLILDNFEHLLQEKPDSEGEHSCDLIASLISRILAHAPETVCLATSRIPLHIGGEREYPLSPLEMPAADLSPAELLLCESVALYEERAKAVRPDFAVNANNAEDVATLCRKLEGMPLAIEMAASWIRTLPPSRILERQERQIDLLTSRRRDLPARHQSLRAAIEWSYDLLTPEQQQFFASLAVFRGGWTLDAAETVFGADTTLEYLIELQEHSLIFEKGSVAATRYWFLEPLREFAVERLEIKGQDSARQAHADYFRQWAEGLAASREWNREKERLDKIASEHDNLLVTLDWLQRSDPVAGLSLAVALSRFWEVRGFLPLGQRWLETMLDLAPNHEASGLRSRALSRLGTLIFLQGEYPYASRVLNEALQIADCLESPELQASALHGLGNVTFYDQQYLEAKRLYEQTLSLRIKSGDKRSLAATYHSLGNVMLRLEQYDEAREFYQQALDLRREVGDNSAVGMSLGALGHLASGQGNMIDAVRYEKEALGLFYEQQMYAMAALCISHFWQMALELREMEMAARLCGAALRLRAEYHFPVPPREREAFDKQLREIRLSLPEETYQHLYSEGASLNMDRAVRYVLEHFPLPAG